MIESSISRERAKAILETLGQAKEYDPLADYYVVSCDGEESLVIWGEDAPIAINRSSTSWLGSGFPK